MTNEEAIKWTKWCISKDKECIQKTIERGFPAGEIQETLEYYEFVLRSLQSISVPTDEPLTLDQLRKMDGKPVWVKVLDTRFNEENQWAIYNADYQMVTLKDGFKLFFCGYESNWLAYAYPSAHIREEWKPCWLCSISSGEPAKHLILPETCNNEAKYCPECGRPITPEAWAELEKRLRGCKE